MKAGQPQIANGKAKTRALLRGLFRDWPEISAGLSVEPVENETAKDAEHRARIEWTNEQLREFYAKKGGRFTRIGGRTVFVKCDSKMVASWSDLHEQEIRFLRKRVWNLSGAGARWRAMKIAQMAADLWGADWDDFLHSRLGERFRVGKPVDLSPAEAHAMMEELESRIARRDGVDIEDVRAKFGRKKAEGKF